MGELATASGSGDEMLVPKRDLRLRISLNCSSRRSTRRETVFASSFSPTKAEVD